MKSPRPICYVVSHERSGTHFTIDSIARNFEGYESLHNVGEFFGPYPDSERHLAETRAALAEFHTWTGLVKTHADHDLFTKAFPQAPVIYVVRDPRDVMVSWWHYLNNPTYYKYNPAVPFQGSLGIGEFLRRPCTPFLAYSYSVVGGFANAVDRWCDHVKGWTRPSGKVLVIRYEDLSRSFDSALDHIAGFLGQRPLRTRTKPTISDGSGHLTRRGVPGDWQNWLVPDDVDFIVRSAAHHGLSDFVSS